MALDDWATHESIRLLRSLRKKRLRSRVFPCLGLMARRLGWISVVQRLRQLDFVGCALLGLSESRRLATLLGNPPFIPPPWPA